MNDKKIKIRMKTCIAGIDWVYKVNDIVEMKERQALNLVNSGQAELVKSSAPIERADKKEKVETPEAKPKVKRTRKPKSNGGK